MGSPQKQTLSAKFVQLDTYLGLYLTGSLDGPFPMKAKKIKVGPSTKPTHKWKCMAHSRVLPLSHLQRFSPMVG